MSSGTSYHRRPFIAPSPPARACAAVPYSHCHCRALIETQCSYHIQQCPRFIFISGALLQCLFRLQLWCVPEVGPASGLGSDSVPQSERSRHQFQLRFQSPYQLQSPRQSLRSLRGSGGTRRGWDPKPRHQCHSADPGGPGPQRGPILSARVSHSHPDLSRHQPHQQQRQHHRHSYRPPPGSGSRYSSRTPSWGMYGSTAETFIRSRTMMSRR